MRPEALGEHAGVVRHPLEVEHRRAKALLTSTITSAARSRSRHHATAPIANERSRKATAPAAMVIRTRPVSRRPAKAQLAERLS